MDHAVLAKYVGRYDFCVVVDKDFEVTIDCKHEPFSLQRSEAITIEDIRGKDPRSLYHVVFDYFQQIATVDEAVKAKWTVVGKCLKQIFKRLICWKEDLKGIMHKAKPKSVRLQW